MVTKIMKSMRKVVSELVILDTLYLDSESEL
jgi:hypothetical protein